MDDVVLWGNKIPESWVTEEEAAYLKQLPDSLPTVEWVWSEMDRVWRSFDMDNRKPLANQRVGDFYSHPVWLMNGLFTQSDPVSAGHRSSIATYIKQLEAEHAADFGGGFGELALAIVNAAPEVKVSIVEPYPSQAGIERLRDAERVSFESSPAVDTYDVIVAQDVLEHVDDPVELAHTLARSVRAGGHVIFANCFEPVIECHIPASFHLRHTFIWVMRRMGLCYVGRVPGAHHAQVFQKNGALELAKARRAESTSKRIGPVINRVRPLLGKVKRLVLK